MTRLTQVPTLAGAPVVGLWPALVRDVLEVLEEVRAIDSDLVRLATPGGRPLLVAKHPRDVRRILVDNAPNYGRTPFHDRLKVALGDGLLTSAGELWSRQRRKLQPLFHARALAGYTPIMAERSRALADCWRAAGADVVVEAERDLSHLALGIVSRALFGDDADHGEVSEAVGVVKTELARRQFWPVEPPHRFPAPGKRRLEAALRRLDEEVAVIQRHAAERDGGVVGSLVRDGDVSDDLVRDEAMTFFLAGHETSAAALAWAMHLLAMHPEVQEAAAEEAGALDAEDAMDPEHLPRTRAIVDESLRLFPPGPWFARRLLAADTLGDVDVPAGTLVIMSPWLTQRDPRWWPEPSAFRPERFAPDAPKPAPMTYFPFAAGPRTCIGMGFARMEMTVAVAAILRAVRVTPADTTPPRPRAEITLRPQPPLRLVVRPRA
jgi:cytochrome P450